MQLEEPYRAKVQITRSHIEAITVTCRHAETDTLLIEPRDPASNDDEASALVFTATRDDGEKVRVISVCLDDCAAVEVLEALAASMGYALKRL